MDPELAREVERDMALAIMRGALAAGWLGNEVDDQ